MRFQLIDRTKRNFPVHRLCRVLDVSQSVGLANVRVIKVALRHLSRDNPEAIENARHLRRSMWSPIVIAGAGFTVGMVSPAAGLVAMIVVTPFVLLISTRLGNRAAETLEAKQR